MKNQIKKEIQGLRALAVLTVLIYHIFPDSLTGGFVGVDVFFVISGYLITGILYREVSSTGRLSIGKFYKRRANRLIPVATLVLVSIAIMTPLLPVISWEKSAIDVLASAFYVQNWWLASQAIDYLASEDAPRALQHFWSLSVEEQYYLVWPLSILALSKARLLTKNNCKLVFGIFIIGIGISSFIYSIFLTNSNPSLAYFSTLTRAWELALGGSLAVFSSWNKWSNEVKRLSGFFGFLLIIYSAYFYSNSTVFPGSSALAPTLGAALIIISGYSQSRMSIYSLLKNKPVQYIGDVSYSLYLWHWPVIILYQSISGRGVGYLDGLIIFIVSLSLAAHSKVLFEDKFREYNNRNNKESIKLFITCMCISIFSFIGVSYLSKNSFESSNSDSKIVESTLTASDIISAKQDIPVVYERGCHVNQKSETPLSCVLGNENAKESIVLFGDSHAAQWVPLLSEFALEKDYSLLTYTKSACAFSDIKVAKGKQKSFYESCSAWRENAISEIISKKPSFVFLSQSRTYKVYDRKSDSDTDYELVAKGVKRVWERFESAGIKVIAIADTPRVGEDIPRCLSEQLTHNSKSCDVSSPKLLARPDPILIAYENMQSKMLINMNDGICNAEICPAVIDGKIVWRDSHHLTASFAKSLLTNFESKIKKMTNKKN